MSSLIGKMQNETSKVEEENPKGRKLVHESDSIQEDKLFKSNLIHEKVPFGTNMDVSTAYIPGPHDQHMEAIVESYVQELILSIKEDQEKHPLPKDFLNNSYDGNCMLRFEDIGIGAAKIWNFLLFFIPRGLYDHVQHSFIYSSGSKNYGFVAFSCHGIAQRFLDEFNGLEIHNTGLSYKLSWAPFASSYESDYSYLDEQLNDVTEEKLFDVSTESSEINEQVDVPTDFDLEEDRQKEYLEFADAFEKFYNTLDEKFHKENMDQWFWPKPVWSAYLPGDDDGTATTFYLDKVDPIISDYKLKRIFDEYGECSMDLPAGKGCGFVKFKYRASAEYALRSLQHVFGTNNICNLHWGIEQDQELYDCYAHVVQSPRPCDILGRQCRHYQQSLVMN